MQPSMFNVQVPVKDTGEVFMMNTLSDAQLLVSPDVSDLLQRVARGDTEFVGDERDTVDALIENGFVVESREHERRSLDEYFTNVREDTEQMKLTVLTTLQCNFACDYCIQGDHGDYNKTAAKMSLETAARVAEWAERREPLFGPVADPCGGLERHLRGVLVVVAVIALDAVVAREVALQRRQHRDAQRAGALADVPEEGVQVAPLAVPVGDDEAVLGELFDRLALFLVRGRPRLVATHPIEQIDNVAAHDELRVCKRVHQEHVVIDWHTNVEHRRLHVELRWSYSGTCEPANPAG